ncbi:MAG TPA: class I SAM-dependent methyltransferase [Usitatibacter sp.]|nr:class I SAM-dependent methyltransferase [Usitatibacter sp.]
MEEVPRVHWSEDGEARSAKWRSERGAAPPKKVVIADDTLTANAAYKLASQGVGLLWRGDFQNARQLLTALGNRTPAPAGEGATSALEKFNLARQGRAQRARTLGMLLIPLGADYAIPLRRAPDIRQACIEAYGPGDDAALVSLRELLGVIGAHEWRRKGIELVAFNLRIHPHYGVFAPVRNEYVDLVARAALPAAADATCVAFDIGTGTGVLAAVLARRGFQRVVATDQDARALACARENVERLGLAKQIDVVKADLFPEGKAALVVCNPPWVPARPSSPLEQGIYDPESRMLKGFLGRLAAHLEPGGEGWLILSDLAEHLGLRTRQELLDAFDSAGLEVMERIDERPRHPRASDTGDVLHAARKAEVTSLWRLRPNR